MRLQVPAGYTPAFATLVRRGGFVSSSRPGGSSSPFQPQRFRQSARSIRVAARARQPGRVAEQSNDKLAVVIVDHGSRREESNKQLEDFVDMYRCSHPEQLVLAAHMELAQPDIKSAVSACAEAGCSQVVVAPYFLSQGRHIQQDIPALVAEAQAAHPGVTCTIAAPIGLDSAVVGVINARVEAALSGHGSTPGTWEI